MKELSPFKVSILIGLLGILVFSLLPKKERFVAVAEKAVPKTVMIYTAVEVTVGTDTFNRTFAGSGVFISENNHILTCAHLFDEKKVLGITVCNSMGICAPADLLAMEPDKDLALLQSFFAVPTPYVRLADPRDLEVGQEVVAIGQPLSLDFTVSHGIISALNRDISIFYNLTQSDVMISPGNSGGPLLNLDGELVGINNMIISAVPFIPISQGLSFSVQPGQIIEFVTRVRKKFEQLPKYDLRYLNDKWAVHRSGFQEN